MSGLKQAETLHPSVGFTPKGALCLLLADFVAKGSDY
jgi:hypothetical protein